MTSIEQRKQDARRRGELKLKAREIRVAALRTARGSTTPSYELAVVETEGRVREVRSLGIDWSNYGNEQRSSVSGGMKTVRGIAAVYNSPSLDLGDFTERIKPGAFARSLASGRDVRCLRDHEDSQLLGRTSSGTLSLNDSPTGLGFSCLLPETNAGRDVQALIERRDISRCSFGMFCLRDDWDVSLDGEDVRTILDADCYDVSVVANPAYPATSCSVRSLAEEDEIRLRQVVIACRRAGKPVPVEVELKLAAIMVRAARN
jgi:uncharacterized protein